MVWRGFGFLVPHAVLLSIFVAARFPAHQSLGGGIALLVSAAVLGPLAVRLNRETRKGHTLVWIPMQYRAVVLGVYAPLIIFGTR